MRRFSIIVCLSVALLAACGGTNTITDMAPSTGTGTGTGGTGGGGTTSSVAAALTLTTSAASILTDGTTTATITALAVDAANNVLAGVPVTLSATSGALQPSGTVTAADGTITATLSTGGNTTARTITVTGKSGSLTSTVQVAVAAPTTPTNPVYAMGNGTGAAFVSGAIGVSVKGSLAAGGTTGLQLSIVDQTGTLYTAAPVTVNFNSPCIASNQAQILPSGSTTPVTTISTTTGSVNATYVASGCSGTDLVTATATVGMQALTATASLTIGAASIGSIQFVSATPTTIGLKGTGLNETSTVIFKVTDSTGGALSGANVTFTLDTTVGGLQISPASAVSASDGTVQTVVSSGTVHTAVRVTATIASPALSTQSSQLTVTTGLPSSGAFSIAVGAATYGSGASKLACPNVEAANIDGVTVPVTVRLADRYNNPVPDGTAVSFVTNGGHIVGSCTTPASTPGDGTCTATWTSADPRPGYSPTGIDLTYGYPVGYNPPLVAAGRATVLATTIGEESFNDANASGFWQPGDAFSNLGEPYRDDNEDGKYELGEYFLDFNQNGVWDAGTGNFVGITCTGTNPGSTCKTSTLAIGASHLIIMSTSGAAITVTASEPPFTVGGTAKNPTLSIAHANSGSIIAAVTDANGNAMAAGTTVAFSLDNTAIGSVTQSPSPFVIGCDATRLGANVSATFSATTAGSGNITIAVTSPNGTISLATIPVTVN